MKIVSPSFITAAFLFFAAGTACAGEVPPAAGDDRDALETGRAIIAVDRALEYEFPENPTAADLAKSEALTKAAVEAGQMTRLYPWVSARIAQEITLAQSRLQETHPDEKQARKLNERIAYLRHLKLLIDAPL